MVLVISSFLFVQEILLWILLMQCKKFRTDEEQFIEDNLQMEYLKEFNINNKLNKYTKT